MSLKEIYANENARKNQITNNQGNVDIDFLSCSKNSSFSVDLDSDTDSIAKLCKENNILPISKREQLELSIKKEKNNFYRSKG